MKSMRMLTTLLTLCVLAMFAGTQPMQAFTEIRDPFVARPMGPYSLVNNPASALETTDLTLRASLGQGDVGGDATQLIAYLEPDMGNGAGALFWHGANLSNGTKRREIGYTVARNVNQSLLFGVTLKHVKEDAIGTWAADLGFMTTDLSRLRAGFVVHNLVGQSTINPTHVTGSVSLDTGALVGVSASLSSPVVSDWSSMEAGVALDILALHATKLRLGRITNVSTLAGYWWSAVQVDIDELTIDATLAFAGEDRRVTIGGVYRF